MSEDHDMASEAGSMASVDPADLRKPSERYRETLQRAQAQQRGRNNNKKGLTTDDLDKVKR